MGHPEAVHKETLEATIGFEPMIEVLQTSALPLGHVAAENGEKHAQRARASLPVWLMERKTRFELATLTLAR